MIRLDGLGLLQLARFGRSVRPREMPPLIMAAPSMMTGSSLPSLVDGGSEGSGCGI